MPKDQSGWLQVPTENNERTRLLADSQQIESPTEEHHSSQGYFFENVAQGIQDRDRARFQREFKRVSSFVWAIISW